jgi:hypothetical protein
MNCLRTTAHTGSKDALPPTPRWRCRPIMHRHPRGHLNHLNRQYPMARTSWVNCHCRRCCSCSLRCCRHFPQFLSVMACCQLKSPLTTNGGAQCHRQPLRHLWHERAFWTLRVAQMGGWHPHPCPLVRQHHRIPLAALCPLEAWGGGIYPDSLTYYAVGRGTSIQLPNELGMSLAPA